jgi:hypothetical protein
MSTNLLTPAQIERMELAPIIWLASVRSSGAPHLVPIWFVWNEGNAYVCTSSRSVKARNMKQNPNVAIALEEGLQPLIIEGSARQLDQIPPVVAALFEKKYEWRITDDSTYDALIEITPVKVVGG